MLTKKEACNVLINVSKKGPSQLTTMDLSELAKALSASKDVEKNKGGEFLLRAGDSAAVPRTDVHSPAHCCA